MAFFVTLTHASGTVSTVSASKLNHSTARELRVFGSNGSYIAAGADVQAGTLAVAGGRSQIASRQGNYAGFYTEFAEAVRDGRPGPVPAAGGVRTLEVLDAARRSALENVVVELG